MGTTINGTIIKITLDGTAIDVQLSASLSVSKEPRVGINKDSGGWEEARDGKKSWEMSGEAEFQYDAVVGFTQIFAALTGNLDVALEFTSDVVGDKKLTGNAQVTKLDLTAGVEEDSKASYGFKGNGSPTWIEIT